MNNEELLSLAESMMFSMPSHPERLMAADRAKVAQAASLLVIARNSMPKITLAELERLNGKGADLPKPNLGQPIKKGI